MEYEEAGRCKELLASVKAVAQKQKITMAGSDEDRDVMAVFLQDEEAVVSVFFVRDGRMTGREHFYICNAESPELVLQSFIKQFYAGAAFLPREIVCQHDFEERQLLESWLSARRGAKVSIRVPVKGTKEKFVELAEQNARMVLTQDRERIKRREGRTIGAAREIAELLGLERADRMEAYDISNTQGYESVGSMVVFEKGRARKNDYRRFRIKTVIGPNDYASMEEVIRRRFTHGLEELSNTEDPDMVQYGSFTTFPDLIMMDGGKGQVHSCMKVLSELGLSIPVCGMVKDDHHRTRGLYFNDEELPIDVRSEGFKLITRIQDEAHRFAIEYHRSLRSKAQVRSVLDDIEGVGPVRRKALLRSFGSAEGVAGAGEEELAQVPGMDRKSAAAVYGFFHPAASLPASQEAE
jgi:excinuclease ABC subunit C